MDNPLSCSETSSVLSGYSDGLEFRHLIRRKWRYLCCIRDMGTLMWQQFKHVLFSLKERYADVSDLRLSPGLTTNAHIFPYTDLSSFVFFEAYEGSGAILTLVLPRRLKAWSSPPPDSQRKCLKAIPRRRHGPDSHTTVQQSAPILRWKVWIMLIRGMTLERYLTGLTECRVVRN